MVKRCWWEFVAFEFKVFEIEFVIKSNESLAENKTKNEIEKFLLKYKHGNNIHEHGKQKSKWATKICSEFITKVRLKKYKYCSSEIIFLLHPEKYKKINLKQRTINLK